MMNSVLRIFVRELLREAAVSVDGAVQGGLALCVVKRGSELRGVVLYDPVKTIRRARAHFDDGDRFRPTMVSVVGAVYCAYTRLACGKDVRSIDRSAARSGYGPLLYDVMLSQGLWMTPDRRSVSEDASSVWKYYWQRRREDVLRRALPGESECILHDVDKPWLNYAYTMSVPVDVTRLVDAHDRVVSAIVRAADARQIVMNEAECVKIISEAGWDFDG